MEVSHKALQCLRQQQQHYPGRTMNTPTHTNPWFHLRRIGPRATKVGVADIMDFSKTTTLIGRNKAQVDFVLDSSNPIASQYISRLHARVILQENGQCRLFNDSLNGIFINNTKMCGSVILQEGDIVTFGHPYGAQLSTGVWKRQPDSEYQFIVNTSHTEHQRKSAYDNAKDMETVLNASKILDHCINKISGLAGSLSGSPSQVNSSVTNSSLNVSTDSCLSRKEEAPECNTEEGVGQKRITDFFPSPSSLVCSRKRLKLSNLDDTIVAGSSPLSQRLYSKNHSFVEDSKDSSNSNAANISRENFESALKPVRPVLSKESGREHTTAEVSAHQGNRKAHEVVQLHEVLTEVTMQSEKKAEPKEAPKLSGVQNIEMVLTDEEVEQSKQGDGISTDSIEPVKKEVSAQVSSEQIAPKSPISEHKSSCKKQGRYLSVVATTTSDHIPSVIGNITKGDEQRPHLSSDKGMIYEKELCNSSENASISEKEPCVSEIISRSVEQKSCVSKETDKTIEKGPCVLEETARTIQQVPCSSEEMTRTITQVETARTIKQVPCASEETAKTIEQVHCSSEKMTRTIEQIPCASGEMARTIEQMPCASEEMARAIEQVPCSSEERTRTIEQVPCASEEMARAIEQVPCSSEETTRTVEQVPCASEEMARTIEQVPCASEETTRTIQQVPYASEETASTIEQVPCSSEEMARIIEQIETAETIEQKETARTIEEVSCVPGETATIIESVPCLSEETAKTIEQVTCVLEETAGTIEQVPCVSEESVGSIEEPVRTDEPQRPGLLPSTIDNTEKSAQRLLLLSPEICSEQLLEASSNGSRKTILSPKPENDDGGKDQVNIIQGEESLPLFNPQTQTQLDKLISDVRRQEGEVALREHQIFLEGWRRHKKEINEGEAECFPETSALVHACYIVSSASELDRNQVVCAKDRAQEEELVASGSFAVSQTQLNVFSLDTRNSLERLINTCHCQMVKGAELEYHQFLHHWRQNCQSKDLLSQDSAYAEITEVVGSNYNVTNIDSKAGDLANAETAEFVGSNYDVTNIDTKAGDLANAETAEVVGSNYNRINGDTKAKDRKEKCDTHSSKQPQKSPCKASTKRNTDNGNIFTLETQSKLEKLICENEDEKVRGNLREYEQFIKNWHRQKELSPGCILEDPVCAQIVDVVKSSYDSVSLQTEGKEPEEKFHVTVQEKKTKDLHNVTDIDQIADSLPAKVSSPIFSLKTQRDLEGSKLRNKNQQMKICELEHQQFIKQWYWQNQNQPDMVLSDCECSEVTKVVKANYSITFNNAQNGEQRNENFEADCEQSLKMPSEKVGDDQVFSDGHIENVPTIAGFSHHNKLKKKNETINIEESKGLDDQKEASNVSSNSQITYVELSANSSQTEEARTDTKLECTMSDPQLVQSLDGKEIMEEQQNSNHYNFFVKQVDPVFESDSEPAGSQFTTSTPITDGIDEIPNILASPVLSGTSPRTEPEGHNDTNVTNTLMCDLPVDDQRDQTTETVVTELQASNITLVAENGISSSSSNTLALRMNDRATTCTDVRDHKSDIQTRPISDVDKFKELDGQHSDDIRGKQTIHITETRSGDEIIPDAFQQKTIYIGIQDGAPGDDLFKENEQTAYVCECETIPVDGRIIVAIPPSLSNLGVQSNTLSYLESDVTKTGELETHVSSGELDTRMSPRERKTAVSSGELETHMSSNLDTHDSTRELETCLSSRELEICVSTGELETHVSSGEIKTRESSKLETCVSSGELENHESSEQETRISSGKLETHDSTREPEVHESLGELETGVSSSQELFSQVPTTEMSCPPFPTSACVSNTPNSALVSHQTIGKRLISFDQPLGPEENEFRKTKAIGIPDGSSHVAGTEGINLPHKRLHASNVNHEMVSSLDLEKPGSSLNIADSTECTIDIDSESGSVKGFSNHQPTSKNRFLNQGSPSGKAADFIAIGNNDQTYLTPIKVDLTPPSQAKKSGAYQDASALNPCSTSPTDSLCLSQISELRDEDDMHLVWSQADVSIGQTFTGSGNVDNILDDFVGPPQTMDAPPDKHDQNTLTIGISDSFIVADSIHETIGPRTQAEGNCPREWIVKSSGSDPQAGSAVDVSSCNRQDLGGKTYMTDKRGDNFMDISNGKTLFFHANENIGKGKSTKPEAYHMEELDITDTPQDSARETPHTICNTEARQEDLNVTGTVQDENKGLSVESDAATARDKNKIMLDAVSSARNVGTCAAVVTVDDTGGISDVNGGTQDSGGLLNAGVVTEDTAGGISDVNGGTEDSGRLLSADIVTEASGGISDVNGDTEDTSGLLTVDTVTEETGGILDVNGGELLSSHVFTEEALGGISEINGDSEDGGLLGSSVVTEDATGGISDVNGDTEDDGGLLSASIATEDASTSSRISYVKSDNDDGGASLSTDVVTEEASDIISDINDDTEDGGVEGDSDRMSSMSSDKNYNKMTSKVDVSEEDADGTLSTRNISNDDNGHLSTPSLTEKDTGVPDITEKVQEETLTKRKTMREIKKEIFKTDNAKDVSYTMFDSCKNAQKGPSASVQEIDVGVRDACLASESSAMGYRSEVDGREAMETVADIHGETASNLTRSFQDFAENINKNCGGETSGKTHTVKNTFETSSKTCCEGNKHLNSVHSSAQSSSCTNQKRKSLELRLELSSPKRRKHSYHDNMDSEIFIPNSWPSTEFTILNNEILNVQDCGSIVLHPKHSPTPGMVRYRSELTSHRDLIKTPLLSKVEKAQSLTLLSDNFVEAYKTSFTNLKEFCESENGQNFELDKPEDGIATAFSEQPMKSFLNSEIEARTAARKHPYSPSSSIHRKSNQETSSSRDDSSDSLNTRKLKILHFLSPVISRHRYSPAGVDLAMRVIPVLPTLSPPTLIRSTAVSSTKDCDQQVKGREDESDHQVKGCEDDSDYQVEGCEDDVHLQVKECEDDNHPTKRRENLQLAVLAELERLTKEIRTSLRVDAPNIPLAIAALEDLDQLPITPNLLLKVPTLLDSVKKCQRYGRSDRVRQLARVIYTRYRALILHMQSSSV
ncbi:methyl-accepting chemotaxis sensory transducer [Plakobranchus ocellatus]|uniref:Methyl-accepting chemotaxis sensory transducer n=1 Tax=Plakobranchus ocellatus TaxID=259542 RepID=A0AAV3YA07_9GAST|nr:methyl-accepting chemotaxis sensory transducer [Plakobranchus ocellatus]